MTGRASFQMVAVGDVMLGDSSHFIGRGVGSRIRKHGSKYPFEKVSAQIKSADLFFANLESPLAHDPGKISWDQVYRGEAKAASALKLGSQNVVSVANNHVLEHGQMVFGETHSILENHGIGCAGYGASDAEEHTSWTGQVNGLEVTLFAISLIREFSGVGVDPEVIEKNLLRQMEESRSDVKIVSVHWGNEFVNTPSPEQVALGRRLIDAGASVVIGHHPHVLQPVEEYGGGIIAYSLGNFVFDQDWSLHTRSAGMLKLTLSGAGVQDWEFIPTTIGGDCQPSLAAGNVAEEMQALVSGNVSLEEEAYRALVVKNTKKYRILMKLELLRHFWKITPATLHFLLTKRKRPRPCS